MVTTATEIVLDLSPEQIAEIRRQARIELIKRAQREGNVLSWGKYLFPDKFPLAFCKELHEYFVSIRNDDFTNTEAPRNHAKTIIQCFLIPMYQSICEPKAYRHYLNVQSTATKAGSVNLTLRDEFENNELLRTIYGNLVSEKKWTEKQFVLRNGVVFTGIGAGESLRGLNYHNIRPDYIMVDDLYDEEDINNPENTLKRNSWFWGSLYYSKSKSRKCSFHLQGTAINKSDLLHLLKDKTRWKSRTFRAITDDAKHEVLWSALNSYDELMADRYESGSLIFNREMMNERRNDEDSIIKEKWLKYYDGTIPGDYVLVQKVLGVDPSIGEKEKNDFTGIAEIDVCKLKDTASTSLYYFIRNVKQEKLSLNERILLLESMYARELYGKSYIEGIAGFKDFVAEVKRRTNLPVKEVDHVKDKISNLESKSSAFETGKVFINRTILKPVLAELIEQLTSNYPNHDDIRDAILLCINPDKNKWLGSAKASATL